eukprot:TRINITY_DN637_c0_g1_i1.p1 TRINITY_DN637_c0_g1~~TRINITY_DN637_c0_g1_i1.p1  ORF type:complete len:501 (-),score=165.08 TRINITY_DN637_c0_g1_i1:124-1626(-)
MEPAQFTQTLPKILCCMCGQLIDSNPSNMCLDCVKQRVDITEGITKQISINFCKTCGKYLQPPNSWQFCEPESPQLLSFCLKKIKGLNKVKLVDAGFVWTEPHSKRLKVKLSIQKEVFNSAIVQQSFIVEYIVVDQMCEKCTKMQTNQNFWTAATQVRQKVDHKRTFYFLEQLIIKHSAHNNTLNIKEFSDGVDFYFGHRSHALKFVDFMNSVCPIRYKTAEKLISQDDRSNTYNINYTFSVEIAPICKDDLICLPTKLANSLGNICPLVLCSKISSQVHVLDPFSLKTGEILSGTYWKYNFRSIMNSRQLIEYIVLDVTPRNVSHGKMGLADVQVARNADFGVNDALFYTTTHLGNLLKPGDLALGYDLSTANFNDADVQSIKKYNLPDVILVRKFFPKQKKKSRIWKLKALAKEKEILKKSDIAKEEQEYEEFLQEVEENPDLRAQINLYKVPGAEKFAKQQTEEKMDDVDGEGPVVHDVQLDELLEDMTLSDEEAEI